MVDLKNIDADEILSEDEIEKLILALGAKRRAAGTGGFTETEAASVVAWATGARVDGALLTAVLKGALLVDVREDGQLTFEAKEV